MIDLENIAPAPTTHPTGDARFAALDRTIEQYNHEPTALIQVLHAAQQLFGYLRSDVLRYIAAALRLPISHVYGVVTFYHFFTMKPRGKHQILVCTGTTCHVCGAKGVLERLAQQLGIREGETTTDNLFSLSTARCVGACALAPVIVVDDDVYGKLSPEKIPKLVEKDLKKYV